MTEKKQYIQPIKEVVRLQAASKAVGFGIKAAAKFLGVSYQTISLKFNGRSEFTLDEYIKLAAEIRRMAKEKGIDVSSLI